MIDSKVTGRIFEGQRVDSQQSAEGMIDRRSSGGDREVCVPLVRPYWGWWRADLLWPSISRCWKLGSYRSNQCHIYSRGADTNAAIHNHAKMFYLSAMMNAQSSTTSSSAAHWSNKKWWTCKLLIAQLRAFLPQVLEVSVKDGREDKRIDWRHDTRWPLVIAQGEVVAGL